MRPGATPPRDPNDEPRPATVTVVVPGIPSASAANPPQPKPGPAGVSVSGVPSQSKTGFGE
jgi:hypothetical protein